MFAETMWHEKRKEKPESNYSLLSERGLCNL